MSYECEDTSKDPFHSNILTDTKKEVDDILTVVKSEPCTLDEGDVLYQKSGRIKVDTFYDEYSMQQYYNFKDETKGSTKRKLGRCASDIITFHSSVKKTEYHELLEFKPEHTKEEQDFALDDDISSSSKMEIHFIQHDYAGPSSQCDIKVEEVDLSIMKMEEDEDTSSESTEKEDGESNDYAACKGTQEIQRHKEQNVYKIHSSKHLKVREDKLKRTLDCKKCEKEFSSKRGLDSHIVRQHSNVAEMMKFVTNTIHHCKHCRYITVRANSLTEHIRTHGGKSKTAFNCKKCRKGFSSKTSLDGHIVALHSSDAELMASVTSKTHSCKYCRFTAVSTTSLFHHLRTHGENTKALIDCIKCKKTYSTKQHLDGHIVALHSSDAEMMKSVTIKIHRCKHCRYITVNKNHLIRHIKICGKT